MDRERNRARTLKGSLRKTLGTRIVEARKRRRWSQVELARRLGVSRDCLGKWERGVCAPGLEELALLSRVLEAPLWELGLGEAPEESLGSGELLELARQLRAMSRLLRPWLERLRSAGRDPR
jgi:transcriptional regulator with XRE-family HTH domain